MSLSTPIDKLPRPLPGFGYAMSVREYFFENLSLNTDPNDNFAIRSSKTLLNTALRCTSYSLPYIAYLSWPYTMYASQYINVGLAIAKGAYSGYSYYQGYTENDENKKEQAKKIAVQALAHLLFASVDKLTTHLNTQDFVNGKHVVPAITAYVGIGAIIDFLGKSKQIHNKWFGDKNKIYDDDDDDDDDRPPIYPERGERNFFNTIFRPVNTFIGTSVSIISRLVNFRRSFFEIPIAPERAIEERGEVSGNDPENYVGVFDGEWNNEFDDGWNNGEEPDLPSPSLADASVGTPNSWRRRSSFFPSQSLARKKTSPSSPVKPGKNIHPSRKRGTHHYGLRPHQGPAGSRTPDYRV